MVSPSTCTSISKSSTSLATILVESPLTSSTTETSNPRNDQEPTSSHEIDLLLSNAPFQPPVDTIEPQRLGHNKTRVLHFQQRWFQKYKWLHYVPSLQGVLCFTCAKAEKLKLVDLANKRDPAFIVNGFRNWKKSLECFRSHESSQCHNFSNAQLQRINQAQPEINAQLSTQLQAQQAKARDCLRMIFTTAKFLARQGLAFRGHENDNGNFKHLLLLRSEDNADLRLWLTTRTDMTSGSRQNEILELLANNMVRFISENARKSGSFSIIVDGTQDCSGIEQEAICLRYIDANLEPHEDFIGMYEPPETSGKTIAKCIFDVLLRLQLPVSMLRGQAYDGASNMAGVYNGCQAIVREAQPLALYVHCGAHCANLVAEKTCMSVIIVRDAVNVVQELGAVFSSSLTARSIFARITFENDKSFKIRPLCPTRWLVRVNALRALETQYTEVLATLQDLEESRNPISAKASGLHSQLRKASTLLGLQMAVAVLEPLEMLNRRLQSKNETVSGMIECVRLIANDLSLLRSDSKFDEMLIKCNRDAAQYGLKSLTVPRFRRPPARFTGTSDAYSADNVADYYKPQFFELIDTAVSGLEQRFTDSVSLQTYSKLESFLVTGQIDESQLQAYNEIDGNDFALQLAMFRRRHVINNVMDAADVLRKMSTDMRNMFSEVEKFVRLLMVCPCSSANAERSFSALRRLKTWLRSTMSQKRLNSVAVSHCHQDLLDTVDINILMKEFAARSDVRLNLFGTAF